VSRQGGIRDGKRGMCAPFDGRGRNGCCGRLCFAVSRDSAFCCEQRFSVHCGIGCEPVIFCGLLACCEQGTECSGL
jgi:hypothetical protein